MAGGRVGWYGGHLMQKHESESSSLLHSIYGSQVSQLPFSDYSSENSLSGGYSDHFLPPDGAASSSGLQNRRIHSRPKSSPASTLAAREERKKKAVATSGHGQLTVHQTPLSQTAAQTPLPHGRPATAQGMRGHKQLATAQVHQMPPSHRRPATAQGMRGHGQPAAAQVYQMPPSYGQPATAQVHQTLPSHRRPATAQGMRGHDQPAMAQVHQTPLSHGRPATAQGMRGGSSNSMAVRPASAGQRRPTSASNQRSRRTSLAARPKTALGMHRKASAVVMNLEDVEEEEEIASGSLAKTTAPVYLTRTPEFFNFWLGKPLQERDFGVKVQKRKQWKRPQSDYGNRMNGRRKSGGSGEGEGTGRRGSGDEGGGLDNGLDGTSGSRDGRKLGDHGDTDLNGGNKGGSGDGGGSGSGDGGDSGGGDGDRNNSDKGRGRGSEGDGSKQRTRGKNMASEDWATRVKNITLDRGDGTSDADGEEYFTDALAKVSWLEQRASSKSTRFELPMDLNTLTRMTPLQYLRKHCIIRMAYCCKIFTKGDKNRDHKLNIEETKACLIKAHHSCITLDQVLSVLEIVQLPSDFLIDPQLFAALCCFTERVLNLHYLPMSTKEIIEVVDFEGLDWKLRNCSISQSLHKLFVQL